VPAIEGQSIGDRSVIGGAISTTDVSAADQQPQQSAKQPFGPIFGAPLPESSVQTSQIDTSAMVFGQALNKTANHAATTDATTDATIEAEDIAASESMTSPSQHQSGSSAAAVATDSPASDVINEDDDIDNTF